MRLFEFKTDLESESAPSALLISFWAVSITQSLSHASFEVKLFLSSFLRLDKSLRTQTSSPFLFVFFVFPVNEIQK